MTVVGGGLGSPFIISAMGLVILLGLCFLLRWKGVDFVRFRKRISVNRAIDRSPCSSEIDRRQVHSRGRNLGPTTPWEAAQTFRPCPPKLDAINEEGQTQHIGPTLVGAHSR